MKIYECHNEHCPLGSRSDPGRFTGGITARQLEMLTGEPIGPEVVDPHAPIEGYCPTCGYEGKATKENHESHIGTDPLGWAHKEVEARVADPTDPLSEVDEQGVFVKSRGRGPGSTWEALHKVIARGPEANDG